MSTIKRIITEYLGDRCQDFDADCLCCKAWKEYDELRIAGLREAVEILMDEGWVGNSLKRILSRIAELEKP